MGSGPGTIQSVVADAADAAAPGSFLDQYDPETAFGWRLSPRCSTSRPCSARFWYCATVPFDDVPSRGAARFVDSLFGHDYRRSYAPKRSVMAVRPRPVCRRSDRGTGVPRVSRQ
jgi:hypothetical protein